MQEIEKFKSTTGVVHMAIMRVTPSGKRLTWCMIGISEKWSMADHEPLTCPHCIRGNDFQT